MYVFGGNDVNRTFSDLWRISLKHIVDCVRRQWYIENQEKNCTGESKNRYHFPEDTVTSLSRCPYKYPQWQCICRNSHLEGKWYFLYEIDYFYHYPSSQPLICFLRLIVFFLVRLFQLLSTLSVLYQSHQPLFQVCVIKILAEKNKIEIHAMY